MKKLDFSIYELLGNELASLLESNMAKSIELGNKANSFFQFLSRESSCERKISYLPRQEDENAFSSYIVHMCNYFITIKDLSVEKFGIDYFNFEIKKFLMGIASNYNFSFSDSIEDGILRQGKVFNFGRGQNNYALTEIVYNTLFENGNDPRSVLLIKNLENGTIIDLSQLLPKREMYFFPTIINPLEKAETENGKNFVKLKGKPFSLNNSGH